MTHLTTTDLTQALNGREGLFGFLHEKLNWPLEPEDTDYNIYEEPEAAGRAAAKAAVSRIVPFTSTDPFVIFLVEFKTGFSRTALREILRGIRSRIRERAMYNTASLDEIVFVCATEGYSGLRFVHFEDREGRQPRMRVFGFDRDSVGETYTLRDVNLPALELRLNLLDEPDWAACGKAWMTAWDVEAVTKNFFRDYKKVFEDVRDHHIHGVQGDKQLFTQRLFNRLLFIHFLCKKGWLRAPGATPENYRDYLRVLWAGRRPGQNFYATHLVPLFFLALNQPFIARDNELVQPLVGDVPYLNGGLFETADDDRKGETIDDDAFDKILGELFGCYNFTISESTPDDQEVAVDPEMLGKVFEELVTGRHESGSYYTPRPVVAFMCREALKGYLAPCGAGITRFVDFHDASGITHHEQVLSALRSVKIVDPACGSGAYLLGILQELMALRLGLFNAKRLDAESAYNRKLEIIQNNIYGVDLDPFAVNTARLRLWLSLVVDDDRDPLKGDAVSVALPNLDFKIECGDSVCCPDPSGGLQLKLFRDDYLRELAAKQHQHGDVRYTGNKTALKEEIDALARTIKVEAGLSHDAFDWRVDFGDVFQTTLSTVDFGGKLNLGGTFAAPDEPGGFNIVLANPPYVRGELIKDVKPTLKRVYGDRFGGTMDLYCFFYYRAVELLKDGGQLVFITPNKWFRAGYGEKLRATIAETCRVRSITDFGDLPVFESATAYPMIFVAQKGKAADSPPVLAEPKTLDPPYPDVRAVVAKWGHVLPADAIAGAVWNLSDAETTDRIRLMRAAGVPLGEYVNGQIYRGVLTGFNAAFVIEDAKRAELIAADPKSAEIIKPLAAGRDVKRWAVDNNGKWLIVTKIGVNIKSFPAIMAHLNQWEPELKIRQDQGEFWWELRACAYYSEFAKPKICYQEIATFQSFAYDSAGLFLNNKVFFIPTADLYLLGLLNSLPVWDYLHTVCPKLQGGALAMQSPYILSIPIPNAPERERAAIAALVQACIDKKGVDVAAEEAEYGGPICQDKVGR